MILFVFGYLNPWKIEISLCRKPLGWQKKKEKITIICFILLRARYNEIINFEKEAKTIFENTIAVNDGDIFEI